MGFTFGHDLRLILYTWAKDSDPISETLESITLKPKTLVLDDQMLYEDVSHIERLYFKMKKYDLAKTYKGAYHQNPAYTHWYGNAELKMDLADIRSEALRLRGAKAAVGGAGAVEKKISSAEKAESRLHILRKKYERGAMGKEEYLAEKAKVMKDFIERD